MNFVNAVNASAVQQLCMQFLTVIFLVGGFALLAIGAGLIFRSADALRFFAFMNRRVSMRHALKPIEIPRDTRQVVQKYRRWLAAIFIAGGVFAIFGLVMRFDVRAAMILLNLDSLHPVLASPLVDSARWLLIVGNFVAIVVGTLLGFFPDVLGTLEARGGRWYSERQIGKGADAMHFALDDRVAASPRASGLIIAFFALILIVAFGLMLIGLR
jgi:hypothetical protein